MTKTESHFRRSALLLLATALSFLLPLSKAEAKVTLAKIFSDGAIFQKDKPVTVFGTALAGEVVTVELGAAKGQVVVGKEGRFVLTLPMIPQSGTYDMKVTGQNTITVKNIRFGQVWLVAGEAVVDAALEDEAALEKKFGSGELADGNLAMPADIMVFKPPVSLKRNPEIIGEGQWVSAGSAEATRYSALGLLFARELHRHVREPIGVIQVSLPKVPIKSWISPTGLDTNGDTRSMAAKSALDEDFYNKLWNEYCQSSDPKKEPATGLTNMASGISNGMLAPLAPYALKGVLFCQGESDLNFPVQYKTLFPVLLKDLRRLFAQEQLPFYYVQMGAQPSQTADKENMSAAASIRHTQYKARIAPKSYLIVSTDLCHEDMKSGSIYMSVEELAKRVANSTLATLYRVPKPYLYPIVEYVENEGEGIKVVFKNAGRGLMAKGEQPVKGFALAGHDHKFFDADAKIEGNTVFLECKYVKAPRYVRYGWGNNPILTIFSLDGLPAVPYTNDR